MQCIKVLMHFLASCSVEIRISIMHLYVQWTLWSIRTFLVEYIYKSVPLVHPSFAFHPSVGFAHYTNSSSYFRPRMFLFETLGCRAHPAISHCSHVLLKWRVATNISHWLKVQSRCFKNYLFAKKCILISFWIFEYCFYYSFTLYYCAIFYSLDAGFFSIPSGSQTVWIQIRPGILPGLIWVQTVCKGYQQTT